MLRVTQLERESQESNPSPSDIRASAGVEEELE